MLIVSGVIRSGTTWVARVCADMLGAPMVNEPHNPFVGDHGDYGCPPEEFYALLVGNRGLFHRFTGHHDTAPDGECAELIEQIMRATKDAFPGLGVAKMMIMPYWGIALKVWPEARIVYMVRGLASWLSSIVRTSWALPSLAEAEWDGPTTWRKTGERWAKGDETRRPLYDAAAFRAQTLETHLRTLKSEAPGRYRVFDYDELLANYELRVPELADYIGAGPVPDYRPFRYSIPVQRSFKQAPFGWQDVVEVAAKIQKLHPGR